jgi:succinoglycan biosynthesis transport protein ExoP
MIEPDGATRRYNEETARSDLLEVLGALKRRRWVIVMCVVVAVGVAAVSAAVATPEYTANATLLFRDPGFDKAFLGVTLTDDRVDPTQRAATDTRLVGLQVSSRNAAAALGMSIAAVERAVKVTPDGQTNLVAIQASDENAQRAAFVANTFAKVFVNERRQLDRQQILGAQRSVQQELRSLDPARAQNRAALARQAAQLKVVAELQTGGVELASNATVPGSPSSPNLRNNLILGLLGGLVVGFVVAFLAERVDRRVRDPSEIGMIYGRPVVGVVPQASRRLRVLEDPSIQESVRLMRASLGYFGIGRNVKTLLITSSMPSEGKSTVALALASAAVQSKHSALVIEADMRRPTLAAHQGIGPTVGLTDVLSGRLAPQDAIVQIGLWMNNADHPHDGDTVSLLAAGPHVPNPGDLVDSPEMAQVISWARERYDLVIIDSPPLLSVSDTMALIPSVDGTLLVARLHQSTRDALRAVRQQLDNIGHTALAVVVNGVRDKRDQSYYYEYSMPSQGGSDNGAVASETVSPSTRS